ncbi:MAG TPA: alpha/beta fold hydrolase [Mycobacteriales bacterium]|jgi:pimeloyl-ACP methyl ester carboxylesterase|nr:alpha/beta fold hydrolase [Mycobacteriales bacterium]HVX69142.1 alpha/beta fold hydrolase [Mycobacteriales bacterium]
MSVPKHLDADPQVAVARIPAPSGELAALLATPPADAASQRGVLLVPGYTGSKEDFWHLLPLLARAGHRTTAIDLRGQCDSGGPEDLAAYTIDMLAADISALLHAASEPLHLVGHSFGGLICRAAVLSGAPARSLTLLGSGPGRLGGHRAALVEAMRPMLADGGVPEVWAATAALNAAATATQPPAVQAFIERRFLASPAAALLGMGEAVTTASDRTHELAQTGVPVLVACGENDDAWSPTEQEDMAQRLGASFVKFTDAGHSPNVDAPAAVASALAAFWATLD